MKSFFIEKDCDCESEEAIIYSCWEFSALLDFFFHLFKETQLFLKNCFLLENFIYIKTMIFIFPPSRRLEVRTTS